MLRASCAGAPAADGAAAQQAAAEPAAGAGGTVQEDWERLAHMLPAACATLDCATLEPSQPESLLGAWQDLGVADAMAAALQPQSSGTAPDKLGPRQYPARRLC